MMNDENRQCSITDENMELDASEDNTGKMTAGNKLMDNQNGCVHESQMDGSINEGIMTTDFLMESQNKFVNSLI